MPTSNTTLAQKTWELALGEASVYDRTKGGVVDFLKEIVKLVEDKKE